MSKLFGSMLPFEVVLLIMGVIVFVALVFLLIWNDLKKEKIIGLLPFFLIPVVLVGYPSLQSIEFKDDGLTIQKYTQAVNANPSDTASRNALAKKLDQFSSSSRIRNNPEALTTIAVAQLALGNLDSAALTVTQASRIDPASTRVKHTADQINRHLANRQAFREDIGRLTGDLDRFGSSPGDTLVTADITRVLSAMRRPAYVDASSALVIARAYAVMNQPAQSVQIINQVLAADTASETAKKLKTDVLTGEIAADHPPTAAQQKALEQSAALHTAPFRTILRDKKAD